MDLDGTIADTLPHLFASFRHAVEPFVRRLPTEAEIVATFGPAERECIARMLANPELAAPAAIEQLDAADRRFHDHYEAGYGTLKTFPGVREVIDAARQLGWYFGVFTGKGRHTGIFTLEHLGLWPLVDVLVSASDVRHPKPHPEGVIQALQRWGIRPEHLLVVGDTPADVQAGRSAGARTIGALWGAFDRQATRDAGPTWALAQPVEMHDVLRSMSSKP
jgi:HAD superfamily hydrolase (TIGR01509 family)